MSLSSSLIIQQTKTWINRFVVNLNLCPFAKREMIRNTVRFQVSDAQAIHACLDDVLQECELLSQEECIETSFLIFPTQFVAFFDYLDFVDLATHFLKQHDYEGVFQLASFHPNYYFANSSPKDVTNYTNRSPYPMLHFLRETSLEKAIARFGDTEKIISQNLNQLRQLGQEGIDKLLAASAPNDN